MTKTIRILVVEDEPKVGNFIKEGLEEHSYFVDLVTDGRLGMIMFKDNSYDLIVLDVLMPEFSGLELCKLIREVNHQVPILMLTALGTMEDKLSGFESGADDYLIKPFEFKELLARIRALTRRNYLTHDIDSVLKIYDLELELDKKKVVRGSKTIALTAKEFRLLEFLISNKDKIVSKEEISEKVWDINFNTGTNFVEVYINLLRKKIDKDFDKKLIHTRFGYGYCFTDNP